MQNEIENVLISGAVRGTPRTYGDAKTEDVWRTEIGNGNWNGVGQKPLQISLHMNFEFRINPRSPRYRGNGSHNGPDIDTMVIGALGGLVCQNSPRPTMKLIEHRGLCRSVTAWKTIVDSDTDAGMNLQIGLGDFVPVGSLPEDGDFGFCVTRDQLTDRSVTAKDRRKIAVQKAAELSNQNQFIAHDGMRIHIYLAFADGLTRNPLSADWLEAVIDGLGASRVGDRRFFDGPSTAGFGYDDSVVYGLTCCQVKGLPEEIGLRVICNRL